MYENELYHHGVKGMKWGRRRARSKSGSSGGKKSHSINKAEVSKKVNAAKTKAKNSVNKGAQFVYENRSTILHVGLRAAAVGAAVVGAPYVASIINSAAGGRPMKALNYAFTGGSLSDNVEVSRERYDLKTERDGYKKLYTDETYKYKDAKEIVDYYKMSHPFEEAQYEIDRDKKRNSANGAR